MLLARAKSAQGIMIHPGQPVNLDYSLTQAFPLQANLRLQLGLVGYGQWQTTDKHGPTVTPEQAGAHYKVNGLGFAANAIFPGRKASVGVKHFMNSGAGRPFRDTRCRFPARLRSELRREMAKGQFRMLLSPIP